MSVSASIRCIPAPTYNSLLTKWQLAHSVFAQFLALSIEAKLYAISHDAHQSHAIPPLYNLIIIFDAVVRQKQNFKHER